MFRLIGCSSAALRHLFTGMARNALWTGLCGVAMASASALAQVQPAQPAASTPGIYTCTDARGRKLNSDRPIAECSDREQKILNPSGTVRAKVAPTLTA